MNKSDYKNCAMHYQYLYPDIIPLLSTYQSLEQCMLCMDADSLQGLLSIKTPYIEADKSAGLSHTALNYTQSVLPGTHPYCLHIDLLYLVVDHSDDV